MFKQATEGSLEIARHHLKQDRDTTVCYTLENPKTFIYFYNVGIL